MDVAHLAIRFDRLVGPVMRFTEPTRARFDTSRAPEVFDAISLPESPNIQESVRPRELPESFMSGSIGAAVAIACA